MPTTLQAIVAVALALLPGALAVWAFERQAGAWGIGLPDRLLRFVGVSATLHAVLAPLTYWVWRAYLSPGWDQAKTLPWGLWAASLLYVALPLAIGSVAGRASVGCRWIRRFIGPAPPPRAWDSLFFGRPDGWIRLRLKSGTWIGGAYTDSSYAAGYPEPGDLYLAVAADVNDASGEFVFDDEGKVVVRGSGILVRWEEVEYLEFIDG